MALSWSNRRKALYLGVLGVIVLIILILLYQWFFTAAPTCFDGKQDGNEMGVDCGGSCALICPASAHAPAVLWARAFRNGQSTYTAAAEIQNSNPGAGAKNVGYSFELFDADNQLVVERDGTVDLPPVATIPIIAPSIDVGNRTVTHALFAFTALPTWSAVPAGSIPAFGVADQNLAPDGSRLSATISNPSGLNTSDITVAAVLFDAAGNAQAASQTTIASLPRQSSAPIVFTWPGGVPGIVRAEITILPSF